MIDIVADVISILQAIVFFAASSVFGYLSGRYYWDADREAEAFSKKCREDIAEDREFRGLQRFGQPELIITSDSQFSRARAQIKKLQGSLTERPDKIVPINSESRAERRKTVIKERTADVYGQNIINPQLYSSISAYFAYRLALKEEGARSRVTEHFRTQFEQYEHDNRIKYLASSENYSLVSLRTDTPSEANALQDVFLPMLRGAERYCDDSDCEFQEKERRIQECREYMMWLFFGLFKSDVKGAKLPNGGEPETCADWFRNDIREEDNRGYWLLPDSVETDRDFGRFKSSAFKTKKILDEYWGENNHMKLLPEGNDLIPQMNRVPDPFLIFRKEVSEFGSGPKHERVKGNSNYRRKEEYSG